MRSPFLQENQKRETLLQGGRDLFSAFLNQNHPDPMANRKSNKCAFDRLRFSTEIPPPIFLVKLYFKIPLRRDDRKSLFSASSWLFSRPRILFSISDVAHNYKWKWRINKNLVGKEPPPSHWSSGRRVGRRSSANVVLVLFLLLFFSPYNRRSSY